MTTNEKFSAGNPKVHAVQFPRLLLVVLLGVTTVCYAQSPPTNVPSPVYPVITDLQSVSYYGFDILTPTLLNSTLRQRLDFAMLASTQDRAQRYRKAFLAAILEPELQQRLLAQNVWSDEFQFVRGTITGVQRGNDVLNAVFKGGVQTTLQNWQMVTAAKHLNDSVNRWSPVLTEFSFILKVSSDIERELFMHVITDAQTKERLECAQTFIDERNPTDPAIREGFRMAQDDITLFLNSKQEWFRSSLRFLSTQAGSYVIPASQLALALHQHAHLLLIPKGMVGQLAGGLFVLSLSYDLLTHVEQAQTISAMATLESEFYAWEISISLPPLASPTFQEIRRRLILSQQIRYALGFAFYDTFDQYLSPQFNPLGAAKVLANLLVEVINGFNVDQYRTTMLQPPRESNFNRFTNLIPYLRYPVSGAEIQIGAISPPTATGQADGSIQVSFSAPQVTGGGSIHHYRVQYFNAAFNPNTVNLDMVGWNAGKFLATVAPGQTETITFSPDRRKIHAGQTCYLAFAAYDDDVEGVANRSPIAFASVVVPANPTGIELVNLRVNPPVSQQGSRLYSYAVQYAHMNNAPPEAGWPKLFIDGVQVSSGIQQVGNNYGSGVEYVYETTRDFSVAAHNFTWEMKADGVTRSITTNGPEIKSNLSGSGARRINGNTYVFFTTWRDAQGRTPDSAKLYRRYGTTKVDIADMRRLGGDPLTGLRYEFGPWTLHHETDYRYYFEFRVGGTTYRDPSNPTDFYTGIVTEQIVDVAVRNLRIEPPKLVGGHTATILADLFNFGSNRETNLVVRARINGVQLGNAVTVDELTWAGTASNYRERIPFAWPMPLGDNSSNYVVSVEVDARPGETNTANNSVQQGVTVTPPPGSISGYVFDTINAGVSGASVAVQSGATHGSTDTDTNGFYRLNGLMPGTYALEFNKGGIKSVRSSIDVHAGQDNSGNNVILGGPTNIFQAATIGVAENSCWSPDNSKVVFYVTHYKIPGDYDAYDTLFRCNADGSGVCRLTGPDKYLVQGTHPEWSPDGNSIICYGTREQAGQNTVIGIFTLSPSSCVSNASVSLLKARRTDPTYHPNGQFVAYRSLDAPGVWVLNLSTSIETQLTTDTAYNLDWSPDGSMIAADGKIINATNGSVLMTFNGTNPCWLPDSSGVLYDVGYSTIWLLYLNNPTNLIPVLTGSVDHDPQVSPNGQRLAFGSRRGVTSYNIHALLVQDFYAPTLYFTDFSATPDPFTPNGDGTNDALTISFRLNKNANVTVRITDSNDRVVRSLVQNTAMNAGSNAVVWDGLNDSGLLSRSEVHYCRLDANNGPSEVAFPVWTRVSLLENVQNFSAGAWRVSPSPDGQRLAYFKNGSLYVSAASGTNETAVWTPPAGWEVNQQYPIDWRADNRTLAFNVNLPTGNNPQVATVDVDTPGSFSQLTFDEGRGYVAAKRASQPRWSPSGDVIATSWNRRYAVDVFGDNIYVVLTNGLAPSSPPYAPGGKLTSVEGTGSTDVDEYPAWSPDGESVFFQRTFHAAGASGSAIYRINKNGTGLTRLTFSPFNHHTPECSPDGTQFLYASDRATYFGGPGDLWIEKFDGSQRYCIVEYGFGARLFAGGKKFIVHGNQAIELFQSISLGQIIGKVVEPGTNGLSPVAGALVQAIAGTNVLGEAFSGANGQFQIFNLPPDSYAVAASKTGYRPSNAVSNLAAQANVISDAGALTLLRLPDVALTIDRASTHVRGEVVLHAEPIGGAVSNVEFAYSFTGSNAWTSIGTVTSAPFELVWDTSGLVIAGQERAVFVRAIAHDAGAFADDEPPVLNLTLDGLAPTALASLTSGSNLPLGALVAVSAVQSNADLSMFVFEIRRQGESEWRTLGVGNLTNLTALLDTGDLIGGQTYEVRVRAIDDAGNADSVATAATFSVIAPVSLTASLAENQIVISWPTNSGSFILIGTNNIASNPNNWPTVLPLPVVVNGQNVVTNSATNAAQFYQLRTP